MLKLYSFGPAANSLKPLLALHERGIPFESQFLSPAKWEQHSDWFKKINPNGQVPALEHDGKIITESTVICEYLEDVFTDYPSLRPADPYLRAPALGCEPRFIEGLARLVTRALEAPADVAPGGEACVGAYRRCALLEVAGARL